MSVKSNVAASIICGGLGAGLVLGANLINTKLSTPEVVGGCVISTAEGDASLAIEKSTHLFFGNHHNLLVWTPGSENVKRSLIGISFNNSADLPEVQAIMTSVSGACDKAFDQGVTTAHNTDGLKL